MRPALEKFGVPSGTISHSENVAAIAVAIAKRIARRGTPVDIGLVELGAWLHDVGRAKCHTLAHGIVGAEMLRKAGYSERVARIVETHSLSGIAESETIGFGLPKRDLLPRTIEEKIVCFADKLSDAGKTERVCGRARKTGVAGRMIALEKEIWELCGERLSMERKILVCCVAKKGAGFFVVKDARGWGFPARELLWGEWPESGAKHVFDSVTCARAEVKRLLGETSQIVEENGVLVQRLCFVYLAKARDSRVCLSGGYSSFRWVGLRELRKLPLSEESARVVGFINVD